MSEIDIVLRHVGIGGMALTLRATQVGPNRVRLSVRSDVPVEPELSNVATAQRNSLAKLLRSRLFVVVDEAGAPIPKGRKAKPSTTPPASGNF